MKFNEGLSLLLVTIIGAGVFALPVLASEVSPFYVLISLSLGFLFSVFLGYTVLSFAPADIEEEVERVLGYWGRLAIHLTNISILLLSLTAYMMALEYHLNTSMFMLLLLLLVPLLFHITFPAAFSMTLSAFLVAFLAVISISNLHFVEHVSVVTRPIFLPPLIAASYFAFFGHNVMGRLRNIVRNISKVKEIVMLSAIIVFLLYLPFVLSTAYVGFGKIATLTLASLYGEPYSSLISLSASVIFYTSFILLGIHLKEMFPRQKYSSLFIVAIIAALYYVVRVADIPFAILISTAGFAVSIWAIIVSVAALKSKRKSDLLSQLSPYLTMALAILPFFLLLFYR